MENSIQSEIVGKCEQMCPAKEIKWRIENRFIHPLELVTEKKFSSKSQADLKRMVKKFVRSAAGQKLPSPENIRTPNALIETINYLINKIYCQENYSPNFIYDFICDRLLAVRYDMVIQNLKNKPKIIILEYSTLFHLVSSYKLCDLPTQKFEPVLNERYLQECLNSLLREYEISDYCSKKRFIFESIYFIYNLGSEESMKRFNQLSNILKVNPMIHFCFKLNLVYFCKNFQRLLDQVSFLPLLLKIVINKHLSNIQFNYLRSTCVAYSSKSYNFSMKELSDRLIPFEPLSPFNIEWSQNLCKKYNIYFNNQNEIIFDKNSFKSSEKIPIQKWPTLNKLLENKSIENLLDEFE